MGLTKTRFKKMPLARGLTYTPFKAPRSISGSKLKIFGKLGRMGQSSFLNMSKRRSSKRINSLERKITGYKISRFRLTNDCSNNVLNRFIGAGPQLESFINLFANGVATETTVNALPGTVYKLRILMFCPTWPGSKLSSFIDPTQSFSQGGSAGVVFTQCWGLEFPNQTQITANLPYNSAGVANVKPFNNYDATPITSTQIVNHDRIKVFSTRIDYLFRNLNPFHKVDVHIFDVIMRTDEYYDFDNVCKKITNPQLFLEEIMMTGNASADNAQNIIRNRYSQLVTSMIRKGRLPPKIFKKLSHKMIRLGRAKPSLVRAVTESGITLATHSAQDHIQKADRRWSKRYGLKTWYKGVCDTETTFMSDDILTDNPLKTVHTLIVTLITDSDMTNAGGSTSPNVESQTFVAYEIKKTQTWKIKAL